MDAIMEIPVRTTIKSGIKEVDFDRLEFGKYVSDHMLVCDYADGEWQRPHIVPYANLSLNPSTLALHYGQTVFEGMKAFYMEDGRINIFRLEKHYERFVRSLERMCMAVPPRAMFMEGLTKLVETDTAWVPEKPGSALYLRPFVYASEAKFGIKVSSQYRFVIFTGPVPELYAKPIKVKVETKYVRAVRGGTGFAKCGGNYGGALYPTQLARNEGYDQVLWTDGIDNNLIEESGMMNVMFIIGNELVTPPVSDSILDGITRDSLLVLAKTLGIPTSIRSVSVAELVDAFRERIITEAFGAGTAAVVAPIGTIHIDGMDYHLPAITSDGIQQKLKRKLESMRRGSDADVFGWNHVL
jgi:branched-chain amino acid aminotransferase